MDRAKGRQRARQGPGNKVIATTLLESLAVRGQVAARDRAARALGLADGRLAEAKDWLPDDAIGRMFVAAEADPSMARAVGHRLIAPDATGFSLYGLGLATPEKAYRRVGKLLPRASEATTWSVDTIGSGSARLRFQPRPAEGDDGEDAPALPPSEHPRMAAALCALRVGMLEAIPGLYGLLPATVKESSCLAKGDDACRYDVRWSRASRTGVLIGGGLGLLAGAAVAFFAARLGLPPTASVFPALCSVVLGTAVGRSVDLHRQLEAVAGARRGHLALFDQVDDALASKLDALARAEAKLDGDPDSGIRVDRSRARAVDPDTLPVRMGILRAARQIHGAAGDLVCWFEDVAAKRSAPEEGDDASARALVRKIRDWAARISEDASWGDSTAKDDVDLVALVTRSIAAARPMLPSTTIVEVQADEDLARVPCEPVQIEEVVVQLLRNAADASHGLMECPEVIVSLRNVERGVELAVEDRGAGIEPSEIDEVFDPFFGDRTAGLDEGFGLPVCLRIVERHGGELRIETEDRPGTRVSILLPASEEDDD